MSPRWATVFLAVAASIAQVATSRLEGVVLDPSEAVVPHAALEVANERTGMRASAESDAHGVFIFPSLPPGEYKLTIETTGFRKAVVTGLALGVASTVTESIRLEIGPMAEALTVEARETSVAAADAQIGRVAFHFPRPGRSAPPDETPFEDHGI